MLVGDPGTRDGALIFPLHRHGETFVFVSLFYSFIQQNFTKCFFLSLGMRCFCFGVFSHSPFKVTPRIANVGECGLLKRGGDTFYLRGKLGLKDGRKKRLI